METHWFALQLTATLELYAVNWDHLLTRSWSSARSVEGITVLIEPPPLAAATATLTFTRVWPDCLQQPFLLGSCIMAKSHQAISVCAWARINLCWLHAVKKPHGQWDVARQLEHSFNSSHAVAFEAPHHVFLLSTRKLFANVGAESNSKVALMLSI